LTFRITRPQGTRRKRFGKVEVIGGQQVSAPAGAGAGLRFGVGARVAVDVRTCSEDAKDFAGMVGVVDEVFDPDGEFTTSIHFDGDPAGESFSFRDEELCAAMGFMPGADDAAILRKLLGRKVIYFADMLDREEVEFVRATNKGKVFYRIERFESYPTLDQIHFVGEFGFRSVYLGSIIGVK